MDVIRGIWNLYKEDHEMFEYNFTVLNRFFMSCLLFDTFFYEPPMINVNMNIYDKIDIQEDDINLFI